MVEIKISREEEINKLNRRIHEFFQDKPEAQTVYIYGSYVSGRLRKGSDIDIAILTRHISDPLEKARLKEAYIYSLSRLLRADVDVVLLRDVGDILAEQILRKGKRIVERDPITVRSYEALRIQQTLDFHITLELMAKGMVSAIREGR